MQCRRNGTAFFWLVVNAIFFNRWSNNNTTALMSQSNSYIFMVGSIYAFISAYLLCFWCFWLLYLFLQHLLSVVVLIFRAIAIKIRAVAIICDKKMLCRYCIVPTQQAFTNGVWLHFTTWKPLCQGIFSTLERCTKFSGRGWILKLKWRKKPVPPAPVFFVINLNFHELFVQII